MANGTDNIITTPGSKDEARVKKAGYKESYPEEGKFPFPGGSLVKGRSAKVSAKAPKVETSTVPSGNLFEPDKSPVGPMINDKGQ